MKHKLFSSHNGPFYYVVSVQGTQIDRPRKKKAATRIRFGTVSAPSALSRGALPVRLFHRRDESKILGAKRLGKLTDTCILTSRVILCQQRTIH